MTPSIQRKDNHNIVPNSNKNLPPKPAYNNNNASYKMPPRPSGLAENNNSVDYGRPGSSRERVNEGRNSSRDKSKENLIRAGHNVVANNSGVVDSLKSPKI